MKTASIYEAVTKPYRDASALIAQAEKYTHFEQLEEKYPATLS